MWGTTQRSGNPKGVKLKSQKENTYGEIKQGEGEMEGKRKVKYRNNHSQCKRLLHPRFYIPSLDTATDPVITISIFTLSVSPIGLLCSLTPCK